MKKIKNFKLANHELAQIKGGAGYWTTGNMGVEGGDTYYDYALFGGSGPTDPDDTYAGQQYCDVPDPVPGVLIEPGTEIG